MTVEDIRKELEMKADEGYREFHSKLLPGTENILGVRIPALRKIAKRMVKDDWRFYLNEAPHKYYEEDMLRGFIIGYADMTLEERMHVIADFIPSIHNWAVCDSFCSTLKFTKKYRARMWNFIKPYFQSESVYEIRFAAVMALDYYRLPEYAQEVFVFFDHVKSKDYYVQMAIAWAVSVYYIYLPEITEDYICHNALDDFTHNKAIQKICESYRVDKETKARLRTLKRKQKR